MGIEGKGLFPGLPKHLVPKKPRAAKKTQRDVSQDDLLLDGLPCQPSDILEQKDLRALCFAQGSRNLRSIIDAQVNPIVQIFQRDLLPEWVQQILDGKKMVIGAHEVYPVRHKNGVIDLGVRKNQ